MARDHRTNWFKIFGLLVLSAHLPEYVAGTQEVCPKESELTLSLQDLKDPAKLEEIYDFFRKQFKNIGELGQDVNIHTTIIPHESQTSVSPIEPSPEYTATTNIPTATDKKVSSGTLQYSASPSTTHPFHKHSSYTSTATATAKPALSAQTTPISSLTTRGAGEVKTTVTVLCPENDENKCFFPVIDEKVDYDGGVAICESRGGHLANIYSQTHMDDVMKYIRENRMDDPSVMRFRLGMKYDPIAKKLTLRDGTDAPAGLKWRPGFPYTEERHGADMAGYTSVILGVSSVQSSSWQFLFNQPPSSIFNNVLCEIE